MVATTEDIVFLFKSKRRRIEEGEDEFYHTFLKLNRAYNNNGSYENAKIVATAAIFENVKKHKERAPDKERHVGKLWWSEVHQNYSGQDFKSEMHLNRDTFTWMPFMTR